MKRPWHRSPLRCGRSGAPANLVRRVADDSYELIAGERRWRAARRAGMATIPAIVRTATDSESLEQALIENLNREELNALEEAAGYQQLIEDFNLTHEQLSTRVGKSRVAITNALRLFQLPPSVQRLVAEGRLSAGHAEPCSGPLIAPSWRPWPAGRPTNSSPSGRSRKRSANATSSRPRTPTTAPARPRARLRPPGILELEELLADHLSTKVRVDMGANRGKVVIEFATLEDLERIYKAMTEPMDAAGDS